MSSARPKSKKSAKTAFGKKRRTPPAVPKRRQVRPLVLLSGEGHLLDELLDLLHDGPFDVGIIAAKGSPADERAPGHIRRYVRPDKRAHLVIDVTLDDREAKRKALAAQDRTYGPETLILTNALAISTTEQASWISGKHRLLGIGLLPGHLDAPLVEVAPSAMTPKQTVDAARSFFTAMGKQIEIVQDRAGLVSARIICQIINEAAFALQDDIAGPADIDTSMKLGVSYPYGPLEWAERIGVDTVVAILEALHDEYKEDRYRIAPLLKRLAIGGVWWTASNESAHAGDAS